MHSTNKDLYQRGSKVNRLFNRNIHFPRNFFLLTVFCAITTYSQQLQLMFVNNTNYTCEIVRVDNQNISEVNGVLTPSNPVVSLQTHPGDLWNIRYNGQIVAAYRATNEPQQRYVVSFGQEQMMTIWNYENVPVQLYDVVNNHENFWGELPTNQFTQRQAVVGHRLVVKNGDQLLVNYIPTNDPNQVINVGRKREFIQGGRYVDRNFQNRLPTENSEHLRNYPDWSRSLPVAHFDFPEVYRVAANPNNISKSNPGRDYFLFASKYTYSWEYPNQTVRLLNDQSFQKENVVYTYVKPYDAISNSNRIFEAYFANYLPFHRALYNGWDVTLVDPRDLSRNGMMGRVFLYPAPKSHAYHPAEYGNGMVPDGLMIKMDPHGASNSQSIVNTSSMQRHYQLALSMGGSLGIPFVAMGGANGNYVQSNTSMSYYQTISSYKSNYDIKYTLFVDESQVFLDPQFKSRVLELLQALQYGQRPDFEGFTRTYGTHYAAAMHMGRMSYCEYFYSRAMYDELNNQGISIHGHISGMLDELLGGSYKFSDKFEWSSSSKQVISQTNSDCWHVGGGMEVPIAADFRPIYNLFNLKYFDEMGIWQTLYPAYLNWFQNYFSRFNPNQYSSQAQPWYR